MSRYKGKQSLLISPIIEATKQVIVKRLQGEQKIEEYLKYYKDYFCFRAIDIDVKGYSNVTAALNRLCENKIYISESSVVSGYTKEDVLLEKSSFNGRGSYARFVLPKDKLVQLIQEIKNDMKDKNEK